MAATIESGRQMAESRRLKAKNLFLELGTGIRCQNPRSGSFQILKS